MPDEPKENGADDAARRERKNTPVVVPATVQDTLKRIANVRIRLLESRGLHERTDQLLEELANLVRRGGSDADVGALHMKLAGHFLGLEEHLRDELSVIFGNLGRAFARQAGKGA